MRDKILSKDKFSTFIEDLTKKAMVFAPVKKNGYYRFDNVSSSNEVSLEYQNSKLSPKEIFLPQTEVLFTFTRSDEGVEINQPTIQEMGVIVFGIRPCDSRGLVLLDKFLSSGEQKDAYYLERREKSVIIGLACNRPRNTCFCSSLGGGPFSSEGMDILLVDLGDRFLMKIVTEKGAQLVEDVPYLKDAERVDEELAERVYKEAGEKIVTEIPVDNLTEKLDGMFDSPFWDSLYQKCLGCGVCTYLCPTCWCFDILDEETLSGGRRIRIWDSCQYPLFTKQASGFNPRPSGKERMRQRIMHKLNYYPKEFGEYACVGCGRCVNSCPVNLDIREVIKSIMSG